MDSTKWWHLIWEKFKATITTAQSLKKKKKERQICYFASNIAHLPSEHKTIHVKLLIFFRCGIIVRVEITHLRFKIFNLLFRVQIILSFPLSYSFPTIWDMLHDIWIRWYVRWVPPFIKFEFFSFVAGLDKISASTGRWFDLAYEDIELLCEKISHANPHFLKLGSNDTKHNHNFFFCPWHLISRIRKLKYACHNPWSFG